MMGTFSIWHWLLLAVIAALVFGGRGRLSSIMGDAAKGIRAFRDGLKGDEELEKSKPAAQIGAGEKAEDKTQA